MADASLVMTYLEAMSKADGAAVSALFTEDGVTDDYRGRRRAGRDVIARMAAKNVPREITLLSDVICEGPRLTVYTHMDYQDGRSKTVRFVFTAHGELIEHLCNSVVEFVPEEFLRNPILPRNV